jgi:3-oxoacyl-[acyl-carrier protein] reductase
VKLNLAGKRAVVTGGTRGLGREITVALAEAGATVLTCYRSGADQAGQLRAHIGEQHQVIQADVSTEEGAASLAAAAQALFGQADICANNVGVDGHAPVEKITPAEWERVTGANLTAMALVTGALLPVLAPGASVINIGAAAARRGRPFSAHHGASKAAVPGLTRSLAREFGPAGVRVNTVAPGVLAADLPAPIADRLRAATALGRLGTPSDIVGTVLFLASDRSRYVTGATLTVDGGM